MKNGFFTLLAFLMLSAACQRTPPEDGVRLDKPLAAELKKTSETISVDGENILLSANLWRDFMPKVGESDNSMRAAVEVTDSKKNPLPENLGIARLMVVKGDSVWVAQVEKSERSNQHVIQAVAQGGPHWKVDDKADVIVELNYGKHSYYLRKAEVSIAATH